MVLYYAVGGGLGHLSRARKVLHALAIDDYKIITASGYAYQLFAAEQIIHIPSSWSKRPAKVMGSILDLINTSKISAFFVDTFPFGILGELNLNQISKQTPIHYVARYLNWKKYLHKLQVFGRFERVYLVDQLALEEAHAQFICCHADQVCSLTLSAMPISQQLDLSMLAIDKKNWLIVHAAPEEEVRELIALAQDKAKLADLEPNLILCTFAPIKEYVCINSSAPHAYFPYVDYIISGCGFNTMLETEAFNKKHYAILFVRKYDDQFLRAQLRNNQVL